MSDKTEKQTAPAAPRFTKAQFLAGEKYRAQRDVLAAVLEDHKTYTKQEADTILAAYTKGRCD